MVVDSTDDAATVSRRDDVLLHSHQNLGLGSSLLTLNHVQIHLIAVEVGIVWCTVSQIESEGLTGHDSNFVHHHRHSMKGWLSVEYCYIAVNQVPLDDDSWFGITISVDGTESVFNLSAV